MPDKRPGRPRDRGAGERGVGGLVGSGPSIVGVSGAMRARDVSRFDEQQLEEALRKVVIRRRAADQVKSPGAPVPGPPVPHPPGGGPDPSP